MAMLKLSPFARGPNRFKPFKLRAVPTPPGILNIAGSVTATTQTIVVPSNVVAGDVLVLADRADSSIVGLPTTVIAAGFTSINNISSVFARQIVSYKFADGTEAGTTLTGMNGATANRKALFVIRSNPKISSVSVLSVAGQMSGSGDPTPQVVSSGSGVPPLAVFAAFGSEGASASSSFVPGPATQTLTPATEFKFSVQLLSIFSYNITADKGSDNVEEGLQSFYLQFNISTPVLAVASITEAGDALASAATLPIAATLAVTEASDTLVSLSSLPIAGTLAVTEANDTLASAAKLDIAAAFARTEANDTLTSAASTTLSGAFAKTEANDTLSADSTMGLAPILADLARTEANDTLISLATFLDLRPGIWREPATASSSWTELPAEGDVWTEEASNPGGWSELSTRSNSWTEEGSESNGWTEELP